jgi:hypothetical protein
MYNQFILELKCCIQHVQEPTVPYDVSHADYNRAAYMLLIYAPSPE